MLIRHGESTWNSDSNGGPRFTGWHDVPLSAEGELQAADAARALLNNLEERLTADSLDEVKQYLASAGVDDLAGFKAALLEALALDGGEAEPLVWKPWGSDSHIVAGVKDLLGRCAAATERTLEWHDPLAVAEAEAAAAGSGSMGLRLRRVKNSFAKNARDFLDSILDKTEKEPKTLI
ncbi:MAG: phosphoglycerate mutase family protein, partial [Pseudomonadota bacterium]|nr:phosphoglycerate mutase family protein [Pseudomonadota bacterium]